ncbi:MAG: AI-2E family transporter [Acetobacter sp.]|nr:AI-2E family transporter [Acetobacter sp.]
MNTPPLRKPPTLWHESLLKLLRTTIITTALGMFIWLLGDVLMIVFASILYAIVLNGLSNSLVRYSRSRLSYYWALNLVIISILSFGSLLFWHSGASIADEAIKLQQALRQQEISLYNSLKDNSIGQVFLEYLVPSSGHLHQNSGNGVASLGTRIAESITGVLGSAFGALGNTFGALGTIVIVLIAGTYFAADPSMYANGFLRLIPAVQRTHIRFLMIRSSTTLRSWVAGQSLDMLVVGLLTTLALWLIGVPLPFALGSLAGICNFIPYIGTIIGAVPALLLSLPLGMHKTIIVAIAYMIIQSFEGYVLTPLIQRHAVQMPAAITVLSQTLFGAILGFPGLIFATPLTAVLLSILDGVTEPLSDEDRIP